MAAWQYAQLRVTYDNRPAAGGGKWTIAWYGPDPLRPPKKAGGYSDVVAALNQAEAEGWELVGVATLDAEDNRGFPDERDWSLTRYAFRRPFNATAKKSTKPIRQGEGRQRHAITVVPPRHPQPDSLTGSKTTEPVTLVRLTGYWLIDGEPAGRLAEGHGPESGAGHLLIRYKAIRQGSQRDVDVMKLLRVEYQNPDSAPRGDKIQAAAAQYAASWVENQFGVTWWQSPQSFPLSQAADLLGSSAEWLRGLVEQPLSALGAASPLVRVGAGITANFVTEPLTTPLESAARAIEIAGIFIGLATGAHPLVIACAHRLAHGEAGELLTKGFEQVITPIGADHDRNAPAEGPKAPQPTTPSAVPSTEPRTPPQGLLAGQPPGKNEDTSPKAGNNLPPPDAARPARKPVPRPPTPSDRQPPGRQTSNPNPVGTAVLVESGKPRGERQQSTRHRDAPQASKSPSDPERPPSGPSGAPSSRG